MNSNIEIIECPNHHFFIEKEFCPFCGEKGDRSHKYRDGDCIDCGQLCPTEAYCCTNPKPIIKGNISN